MPTITTTPEILTMEELYRRELARQLFNTPVSPLAKCLANINHLNIRNLTIRPTRTLGDYLGNGYDALTDEAKWPIFKETYDNCNTSADFRYYVPDFYRAEKIYQGNIDKSTKMFKSMKAFEQSTSAGVGVSGGQQSNSGSFSASVKSAKSSMQKKEKTMIFLKAFMLFYRLEGYPGAHFTDDFRERVMAVVEAMRNNLNRLSRWLVEEIYRDFGMEVIMGADLGIKLERTVFISSEFTSSSSEFALDLKASLSMQGSAGVKARFGLKIESKSKSMFSKMDRIDKIKTWGGPNFDRMGSDELKPFMELDNLAALTYTTLPTHKMMHGGALGRLGLNGDEILNLRMLFENVYDEVIERNTYRGCTDRNYYNFDFQANVDDNTCDGWRCSKKELSINCIVPEERCSPVINLIRAKFDEVTLRRYEKASYNIIMNLVNKAKGTTIPYSFNVNVDAIGQEAETYENTLYEYLEAKKECIYKNVSKPADAKFLSNPGTPAYKKCLKDKKIEEENGKYYDIVCNNNIPDGWKNEPIFGGFYQVCKPLETTLSHDDQLKQLGKGRESRCDGLNVINIVTKAQSCPEGMNKTLIKNYIHTLPDYYVQGSDFTGKKSVEYTLILKDQVNISTYWCDYGDFNKRTALYFGGSFEIGQLNSYIADNGCGFTGMNESRIFHDTKICIETSLKTLNKKAEQVAELRSIFTQQSFRSFCGPKESKRLITVINNDRVYACIYKKQGYFDAPFPQMAKLPFKEQQTMFEFYGESMLLIAVNGVSKNYTLKSIGDQFLYEIRKQILEARDIEPTTTVVVEKMEDSLLFSNKSKIGLIIAGVALLIVGGAVAAFFIQRSLK
uniref:Macrophage-expressed gene 1 protein n=1 Tax=Panagrellus redivivus TaxID=6233 RepID=A0A7E4UXF1_PANRE